MRHRQRGMSYIGYMFLAVVVGVVVKVSTTVIPPYLDFHSIDAAIHGTVMELGPSNPTPSDVLKSLSTHFQVEGVGLQNQNDLVITKDGNTLNATLKYDVQRPFVGNIDLVFHFYKTYSSSENSGQ